MRTPQQPVALFTSLLLILLLELIVIYDCDCMFDETETIIMECVLDYVNLLVEYIIMSVLIFPTRIITTYSLQGIPNILVVVLVIVVYIHIYIYYIYIYYIYIQMGTICL